MSDHPNIDMFNSVPASEPTLTCSRCGREFPHYDYSHHDCRTNPRDGESREEAADARRSDPPAKREGSMTLRTKLIEAGAKAVDPFMVHPLETEDAAAAVLDAFLDCLAVELDARDRWSDIAAALGDTES